MLMRDTLTDTIAAEIEATKLKFEKWRRSRTGQERIPETLWSEAVGLAWRDGARAAGRGVRLDYNKLKQPAVMGKKGRGMEPSTTVVGGDSPTAGNFGMGCG